jgi:DNA-directed RNA polymerase specialized sigma24 family protein
MGNEGNMIQSGAGEDDCALVERAVCGDRRAFESLVRRHERRVYRITLAVLGNAWRPLCRRILRYLRLNSHMTGYLAGLVGIPTTVKKWGREHATSLAIASLAKAKR